MRWRYLVLVGLLAAGCDQPPPTTAGTTVSLGERMATEPAAGFERAIDVRAFRFPQDHGAHPTFATEWWYFTGNLNNRFGYQLTLFRIALDAGQPTADSDWRTRQMYMGHLAVSDIEDGRHYSAERFARAAVGLAGAEAEPFRVWLGPWSIRSKGDEFFPLHLVADSDGFAIDLTLEAGSKPLVLQGDRGLSQKSATPGNASYYYSFTRLPTQGEIRIAEERHRVSGNSWFDREWSSSALAADQQGWDWFALQLDNGQDLMFYQLRDLQGVAQRFSSGILVDRDGSTQPLTLDNTRLTPVRYWQAADGTRYPVEWQLVSDALNLDLVVKAAFDNQEMPLTVRYWEGAVTVSGSHRGVGYLELSGYAD